MRLSATATWVLLFSAFSSTTVLSWSSVPLSTSSKPQSTGSSLFADSKVSEESASVSSNDDDDAFLTHCKELCQQRNIPFDKIKNARDLASVANSPIKPGRIFRMGRVSDATEKDIALLLEELDIKTLVDLRSPTELKDDPTLLREAVFQNFTNVVWKEQGRKKDGCLRELKEGEGPVRSGSFWKRLHRNKKGTNAKAVADAVLKDDPEHVMSLLDDLDNEMDEDDDDDEDCGYDSLCTDEEDKDTLPYKLGQYQGNRRERHFVSLMNEFKYVKGTVSKVRKRDITKAILKSPGALLSRRVRSSIKEPFLNEINGGGLHMLNELLLRFGAPGIRYVLELCADRNRHPIAFYCTAGKDRTGMIAAIVLALCGVKSSDIVEDYTLSANVYAEMNDHKAMVGALSQRNLNPKTFLGAPPDVMRDTLIAIETEYGSVEGYCDWIGFGSEKQQKLREACLND